MTHDIQDITHSQAILAFARLDHLIRGEGLFIELSHTNRDSVWFYRLRVDHGTGDPSDFSDFVYPTFFEAVNEAYRHRIVILFWRAIYEYCRDVGANGYA